MSFFNRNKRNRTAAVELNPVARAARAAVESLEPRQLLTTTVQFVNWAPPAVNEGEQALFTLERQNSDNDYSDPLTVNLTFQGLSIGAEDAATSADVDAPDSVTFGPGQQYTEFSVTAIDDDHVEGNEWYQMSIASGGYDIGQNGFTSAIIESDVPIVWLSTDATGDDAPKEGDDQPLRFVAHRDNTEGALKIWFYAGSFNLVEGDDYTLPGTVDPENGRQTLTFADGEDTLNIDVAVIDDQAPESTESLTLGLYGSSSDLLAGQGKYRTLGSDPQQPDFAEGQIRDNDTRYVWVTADQDGAEDGRTPATFTFHRSGDWDSAPSNKAYFTLSGAATPGEADSNGDPDPTGADYGGATASQNYPGYYEIEFASGDTATLTLTPFNDANVEGSENMLVSIVDVQDANGFPLYVVPANMANQAAGMIVDLVGTTATDAGAPSTATLDSWLDLLDSDQQELREGAYGLLEGAFSAHPAIGPYLDEKLSDAIAVNGTPEVITALKSILGPVRFHIDPQSNVIVASFRYSVPRAVNVGVSVPGGDAMMTFAVTGDPNAGSFAVGGNPSSITISPKGEITNKIVTFHLFALDANDNVLTQWDTPFAFDVEDLWSI